jgi:hypothetical protein
MKIQGVNITGGIRLIAPTPTPSGPSKFVVGAYGDDSGKGAAYLYNLDGTSEVKITASDGASGDRFGWSVAVADNHIVVGADYDADAGSRSGSVYVYNLDGTGEVKITASDGAVNDRFGAAVAINSTKIVVGAPYNDDPNNSGSVYVYNTDGTGEVKITASDAADHNWFGTSVAVTDSKIIVGAAGNNGAVYVYNLDGTGELKIVASDGNAGDRFGYSVAVSDSKIVVGAIDIDAVYVYNLDGTGEQKITTSVAGVANYGITVSISDTQIAVGSGGSTGSNVGSGSTFVYDIDGTNEMQITAIPGYQSDNFGGRVSITANKILIGADGDTAQGANVGSVYLFDTDGTNQIQVTASDGTANSRFGGAVSF